MGLVHLTGHPESGRPRAGSLCFEVSHGDAKGRQTFQLSPNVWKPPGVFGNPREPEPSHRWFTVSATDRAVKLGLRRIRVS